MWRSKSRGFLTLLVVFMLVVALAGCGGQKGTDKASGTGQKAKDDAGIPADQLMAKGMNVDGFSYDYIMTMPGAEKYTSKMWVKGGNMRSEMENPAGGEPLLTIVSLTDKAVYIYQPDLKQAMKMPIDQSDVDTTSPKDYIGESDPANMVFIKRETYDGKKCLVYETRFEGGSGTMWVWEDYGMPLRIESQSGADKVVVEFLNFKVGGIDDSLFKLPEGTQIMDLSSLMPR